MKRRVTVMIPPSLEYKTHQFRTLRHLAVLIRSPQVGNRSSNGNILFNDMKATGFTLSSTYDGQRRQARVSVLRDSKTDVSS
jgi:hypothetical protein